MSLNVCVKEQVENELDLKKAYEEYPYDHEIKIEVDIGPELLQAPSTSVLPDVPEENTDVTVKKENDHKLRSSCFIRLERLHESRLCKKPRRSSERLKTCEYCQRQFRNRLKYHQKLHVKQLLYSNDDNIAAKFGYIVKTESDMPYACDVCFYFFIRESDLIKHMKIHEPVSSTLTEHSEENILKQYPERDNFNFKKADAKLTPCFCVTCDKVIKVPFDLFVKHLLNHIDENPLLKQMLKEFVLSDRIERSCSGQSYIFACHNCNYRSHREGLFRKHMMHPHITNDDTCKSANETNDSSTKTLVAYSLNESNGSYRNKKTELTCQQPSILAAALTSNKTQQEIYKETMASDSESTNESIDFQKSSLFSRLKLLNKVVGK